MSRNLAIGTNKNIPQIPHPLADLGSLAHTLLAIKQAVDSLAGFRGQPLDRAVTLQDLVTLGIIDALTALTGVSAVAAISLNAPQTWTQPQTFTGGFAGEMLPIAKTANYSLTATDCGKVIHNSGATGAVTLTLPVAQAGLTYTFLVMAAQTLTVQASGTDKIAIAATNSVAGGHIAASAVFAAVTLVAIGTGQWAALASPDKTQWTVT